MKLNDLIRISCLYPVRSKRNNLSVFIYSQLCNQKVISIFLNAVYTFCFSNFRCADKWHQLEDRSHHNPCFQTLHSQSILEVQTGLILLAYINTCCNNEYLQRIARYVMKMQRMCETLSQSYSRTVLWPEKTVAYSRSQTGSRGISRRRADT